MKIWALITGLIILNCFATLEFNSSNEAAPPTVDRKSNLELEIALNEHIRLKRSSFQDYVKIFRKNKKQRRKPKSRILAHVKPYSRVFGPIQSQADASPRSFSHSHRLQELNPTRLKQPIYIKQKRVQTKVPEVFHASFPMYKSSFSPDKAPDPRLREHGLQGIPIHKESLLNNSMFNLDPVKRPSSSEIPPNDKETIPHNNPFFASDTKLDFGPLSSPIRVKEQKINQAFMSTPNNFDSTMNVQVTTFPSVLFLRNNQKTTVTTNRQSMNILNEQPSRNKTELVKPPMGMANTAIVNFEGSSDSNIRPLKSRLPLPDTQWPNSKLKDFSSDGSNKRPLAISSVNQDNDPFLKNTANQNENNFIEYIINKKFSFLQLLKVVIGGYQDNSIEISENDSLGYLYDGIWSIFIPLLAVAIIEPIVFLYLAAREVSIPVPPWVRSLAFAFNRKFPLRVKMVTRSIDHKKEINNFVELYAVYKQIRLSKECLERMSCQHGDGVGVSYWNWIHWFMKMFVPAKFWTLPFWTLDNANLLFTKLPLAIGQRKGADSINVIRED